ncbi:class I SAM-dependent methyltransferase [Cytobacillus eiseniae]|nr:class I SAM-dependent methyltransferase [Cytobacillus eiseniae]
MIRQAKLVAHKLNGRYIERKKRSVQMIQTSEKVDCLVVGKERLELYPLGETAPFFFHPNSAMFRIRRLMKGDHDPFLEATRLETGKSLLDCTLGLASDCIVASFAVGTKGKVTGIEGNACLAYIVKEGLNSWESGIPAMNQAMKQIKVTNQLSLAFLKSIPDGTYDCVYFDPMFEEHILDSDGIEALSHFAIYEEITDELINEAIRVAKERVVLKDHFRSTRFSEFGFEVFKRKTAKFHFGVIEK